MFDLATDPVSSQSGDQNASHRFCVAPMIDVTDKHFRFLCRLLSKRARLYTEMITTGALLHGEPGRWLDYNAAEHPLALQLGGSEPTELAACAKLGEQWGYDEINLNCGCPSDRVQSGRFGACLMAEPELVADCVAAMSEAVRIPVTVKHRIGIDDQDEYADLSRFVDLLAAAGCRTFVVHARKAWLQGLSPKENREIPPLNYARVFELKKDFPQLNIILNGGMASIEESGKYLETCDGVMLGREVARDPYLLARVDQLMFGVNETPPEREQVLHAYAAYCAKQIEAGTELHHMSRHILNLFHGQKGGRLFRRFLSEQVPHRKHDKSLLLEAFYQSR